MVRWRWLAIAASLGVAAALASGLTAIVFDNSIEVFLHDDDPALERYDAFREQFGSEDVVVLAIESPRIFSLAFLEKLRAMHAELEERVPHVEDVVSLVNARSTRGEGDTLIVEDLLADWPRDAAEVAALRERVFANPLYLDALISRDGRLTTLTLEPDTWSSLADDADTLGGFEESGVAPRRAYLSDAETGELVATVREVMARYDAPDFRLHLAGAPVMGDRTTQAMQRDLVRFAAALIGIELLLLFALFRRLTGVLLPVLVVVLALLSTLGAMGHLGIPLSLPIQVLPSFLLAVGLCDAIHLLAIHDQRLAHGDTREDAIAGALRHSGVPVVLTSLTTAGGLLSFAAAEIAPVAHLGVLAPLGVMLAMGFSLVLLPALLALAPVPRAAPPASRLGTGLLVSCGELAVARPLAVVGTWGVALALAAVGASGLRFSQNQLAWMPEDEPVRRATLLLDQELSGVMTLEMLARSDRDLGLQDPALLARLDAVARDNRSVRHDDLFIAKTVSLVDVLKETHQALHENRPEYYALARAGAASRRSCCSSRTAARTTSRR